MTKYKQVLLVLLIGTIILAGCNTKSEEEIVEEVKTIAETTFKESVETNTDLESFSLYLPSNYEITQEVGNNLSLENDEQTYILFYNPIEDSKSQINFQDAEEQKNDNYLLLESFSDENKFGYVKLERVKEDEYELQTGIGPVKITAIQIPKGDLEDATSEMMKIAVSIVSDTEE